MEKKDFSEIKIIGCLMVHDNIYTQRVLDSLAKYTDTILVNLNDATEENKRIVENHPCVKKIMCTENLKGWRQAHQRGVTARMADEFTPDLVLFPDDDEFFPSGLINILKDFWESDKKALYFTMDYYWDNEQSVRKDGQFGHMHHVRVFKWEPNITYKPYPGKACPRNVFGRSYAFYSPSNIIHLGYMTEEDREKKYKRDGKAHYITVPTTMIKKPFLCQENR